MSLEIGAHCLSFTLRPCLDLVFFGNIEVVVRWTHWVILVRELADGVLSSAAVPRCGLGPLPPPLCRCAEYTADQLLRTW
jgi:hypothetical protein